MMRVRGGRSAYETRMRRDAADMPITRKRRSSSEWSGSGMFSDKMSPKTEVASSNETSWAFRLDAAFFGSHSKLYATLEF